MAQIVHQLLHLDRLVLEQVHVLRWEPLTAVAVVASAWWVKGLAFVTAGAVGDIMSRRRLPTTAASAALALALVSALATAIKDVVDRARPAVADPSVNALVATPHDPSFPSAHAATSFAAAVAVGSFCPRLRVPLLSLAALVALSRVYLGVHYGLDVVAGAALGIVAGLAAAWVLHRAAGLLRHES